MKLASNPLHLMICVVSASGLLACGAKTSDTAPSAQLGPPASTSSSLSIDTRVLASHQVNRVALPPIAGACIGTIRDDDNIGTKDICL